MDTQRHIKGHLSPPAYFTGDETKAQRGTGTYPTSHCYVVAMPRLMLRFSSSRVPCPSPHAAIFSESLLLKSTPGGRATLGFGRRSFQFQSRSGSSHLGCPCGARRGAWPSKPQELHHTQEPRPVTGALTCRPRVPPTYRPNKDHHI